MMGQSGGVCHLFMYTAIHEGIGLNKVVGLGNRSDVDFSDLVEYLDQDPDTHSIALYIEGIEEPSSLLKSARSIVSRKPIVALKGGKSEAIAKASIAHTGAMTGRHALYQASFSQFGIVAVDDPTVAQEAALCYATHIGLRLDFSSANQRKLVKNVKRILTSSNRKGDHDEQPV